MALNIPKEKILLFLFSIFLIFLIYHFRDRIKNTVYLIASPIEISVFDVSKKIFNFYESIVKGFFLERENEELKEEIKKLTAENEKLKELKKENEEIRKALGLELEKKFTLEISRFIGKDFSGDFIRINKGSKNGMKEGMVVITPENCLVGKIFKVYPNFSTVQVFTDKDFSFDVKISEKEVYGLAKGEGNFRAKIEFIPKEKEVSKGDKILTSPLGGKFPGEIFVGEIEKIEKSDITFYQETKLKPAFDIGNLDYLFVILNF